MGFSTFLNKAKTASTKFFGSTLPSTARNAHTFFNNHIAPNVRRIHSGVRAATDTLQNDPTLSDAAREKVKNYGKFADLGLERFNSVHKTVDNVARAM